MSQSFFEHHIGIDVSKATLDVYCLPQELHFQVANSPVGIAALVKQLPLNSAIILESTGGYERMVARSLDEQGYPVCVINPMLVYHFKQSLNLKAKTDKIDARVLALFAQARPTLRYGLYSNGQQTLLDLQRCREQLKKMRQQSKNRWRQTVLPAAKAAHQCLIDALDKQIQTIEDSLLEQVHAHEAYHQSFSLLQSIPGIGANIALTLVASLPEMGKLTHKALHRLVGVAPMNRDSGTFRGKRFIQGGRQAVRDALYMSALVSVRYSPLMKAYYQQKVAQGKPKKSALVACIAKIVRIINSVIRQQRPFVAIENGA
jgi:transposase